MTMKGDIGIIHHMHVATLQKAKKDIEEE